MRAGVGTGFLGSAAVVTGGPATGAFPEVLLGLLKYGFPVMQCLQIGIVLCAF